MSTKQQSDRKHCASEELQEQFPDLCAQQIVDSLTVGLTRLRDLLIVRTCDDVERKYGTDSMIGMPSLIDMQRQARLAKAEIEAYSCIVVDDEVARNGHIDQADEWFLDWMFRLRLGEGYEPVFDKRVNYYHSRTIEERRLKFVSVLQRAIPGSAHAPLVLFRLYPRAVRILAAVAFGDVLRAAELREEQISFLPAICDCPECHGRVMDNEDTCRCCGNPVWNFAFLLSD